MKKLVIVIAAIAGIWAIALAFSVVRAHSMRSNLIDMCAQASETSKTRITCESGKASFDDLRQDSQAISKMIADCNRLQTGIEVLGNRYVKAHRLIYTLMLRSDHRCNCELLDFLSKGDIDGNLESKVVAFTRCAPSACNAKCELLIAPITPVVHEPEPNDAMERFFANSKNLAGANGFTIDSWRFYRPVWDSNLITRTDSILAQMPLKTTFEWSCLDEDRDDVRIYFSGQWQPEKTLLAYSGNTVALKSEQPRAVEFHLPTPCFGGTFKVRYFVCTTSGDVNSFYGQGVKNLIFWGEKELSISSPPGPQCNLSELARSIESINKFSFDTMSLCDEIRGFYASLQLPLTEDANSSIKAIESCGRTAANHSLEMMRVHKDCAILITTTRNQIDAAIRNAPVKRDSALLDAPYKDLSILLDKWLKVLFAIERHHTRFVYSTSPTYNQSWQKDLFTAVIRGEAARLTDSLVHVEIATNKLQNLSMDAAAEEQKITGRITRFARRNYNRVKDGRIAKETVVAFDSLILGTKMIYEALDMRSQADVNDWMRRHISDFEKLSESMRKIQSTDGWSLTDIRVRKPLEGIVERIYKQRFQK